MKKVIKLLKGKYLSWLSIAVQGLCLVTLCSLALAQDSGGEFFYWYQGGKIPLRLNREEVAVKFKALASDAQIQAIVGRYGTEVLDILDGIRFLRVIGGSTVSEMIDSLQKEELTEYVVPVFAFGPVNQRMTLSDRFNVKFRDGVTRADVEALNNTYGVAIVGRNSSCQDMGNPMIQG